MIQLFLTDPVALYRSNWSWLIQLLLTTCHTLILPTHPVNLQANTRLTETDLWIQRLQAAKLDNIYHKQVQAPSISSVVGACCEYQQRS